MDNHNVHFHPFQFVQDVHVIIRIDRKLFFQQRLALLFGAQSLHEILQSPNPVIVPLIDYTRSFDVHVFILY